MTELRLIAKNCSFGNLEVQLVRDQLVCCTDSEEVRQWLLKVEELMLDKAISICRTHEETKKNAQYLNDSSTVEVCDLKKKSIRPTQRNSTSTQRAWDSTDTPKWSSVTTVAYNTPRSNAQHLGNSAESVTN